MNPNIKSHLSMQKAKNFTLWRAEKKPLEMKNVNGNSSY